MQSKSLYTTLFVTTMATSTLLFSGCNQASANVPVATVNKSFKTSFDQNVLESAVTEAAKSNSWKIVSHADGTTPAFRLKKSYTKMEDEVWGVGEINYDVLVDVNIANNTLSTKVAHESLGHLAEHDGKQLFNSDLAALEHAIYVELIPHAL